jgi:phosphomannomutase
VRGLYPEQIDADVAERIGRALAQQLGARRLAVGADPRPSSPELAAAFAAGAAAAGAPVTSFGTVPTEMLYYGVAERGFDGGAMITASHNPKEYNGLKLVGEGALPLSGEAGIPELMKRVLELKPSPASALSPAAARPRLAEEDLYPDYVRHLHTFAEPASWPPFKVVMDAANGVAGALAPLVFDGTPLECVRMYFEVDGTFPNHAPNPLLEENSREIRARVLAERAALGIAWDGDADRCFFIDEAGEFVPGDFVTALLAEALLLRHPGAAILYDLRASRAVPDMIRAKGGVPLINRVGHAFFKQRMRKEPVLFGGEVSGHYYFRDNHNADSGFIPALLMLDLLARKRATLAELLEPLRSTYFISGEINSTVDDVNTVLARLHKRFADGYIGTLDGISVDYPNWHFNVRPSNTEPLVRLNLGADSRALMEEKRDLVLGVIRRG